MADLTQDLQVCLSWGSIAKCFHSLQSLSVSCFHFILGLLGPPFPSTCMGWLGGVKVSCILRHRGIQLILAYSWARPAILVAGKDRWGIFLFLLFLHFHSCSFLPCPSLSSLLLSLLSLFSLSLGDNTKWPTRVDVSLNPNTINQSINLYVTGCLDCTIGAFQMSIISRAISPSEWGPDFKCKLLK